MIMTGQEKRLSEPLRWGRREKVVVTFVATCAALIVLGFGAFALTSGAPARADCVEVIFPSTLGAGRIHDCGARARELCAKSSGLTGLQAQLATACRKAGFRFG